MYQKFLLSKREQVEKEKTAQKDEIYSNTFEWRFEFPQVLNDDSDFVGFDVVIGNPPYSGESANKGEWIMKLMEDYKKDGYYPV